MQEVDIPMNMNITFDNVVFRSGKNAHTNTPIFPCIQSMYIYILILIMNL